MSDVVDVVGVETHADHIDAMITDHIDAARPVRAATTGQDGAIERVALRLDDPDHEYVLCPAQL